MKEILSVFALYYLDLHEIEGFSQASHYNCKSPEWQINVVWIITTTAKSLAQTHADKIYSEFDRCVLFLTIP